MRSHHANTSIRRPVVALLILNGCYGWHTEQSSPELVVAKKPAVVRVVRLDGSRLEVFSPKVAGDSLVGLTYPNRKQVPIAVALADMRSVKVRQVNAASGVVGLVLVLGVGAVFMAASAWDGPLAHWGE
ncbi:MAG: hypothetical protein H0U85_05305 [Gemmatimonadales bacterium]|nr:hypothetical protein [Gemmatimonadales bacterium]